MKPKFYHLLILLLFLFVGCDSLSHEKIHHVEPRRASGSEELGREHFLYDINYFEYILENNFGLLDVAYWHNGVDLRGIIGQMREEILDEGANFRKEDFFYLWTTFFSFVVDDLEDDLTNSIIDFPIYATRIDHIFPLPFAHFSISLPDAREARRIVTPQFIQLFEGREYLLNEFLEYYAIAPCRGSLVSRFFAQHFEETPPLVRTSIIEEGRIGYLAIRQFSRYGMIGGTLDDDLHLITAFFDEVEDFEHLIIDLRGNLGGDFNYFINNIVRPLINEPKYVYAFYFTPHGELAREFTGEVGGLVNRFPVPPAILLVDNSLRCTHEILTQNYMPEIRTEDFHRLPYGLQAQTRAEPLHCTNFNGKIWMLTDGRMGSAGQLAAWFSKESGFATLVGDTTGGNYGGVRTTVSLPNTGIYFTFDMLYATDMSGRPLEAGTVPHHFNQQNLDAIETALLLILDYDQADTNLN